jgi:hypothetical protein
MPNVPGFIASVNGLHFTNSFPSEPDIAIPTPVGNIGIGDASNGLCGGMVFTVMDIFTGGLPPLQDLTQPADPSPLFNYIVKRLLDSFGGIPLIAKYFSWMQRPYHDTWFFGPGTVSLTIGEWPGIKGSLDAGAPVPLACIIPTSSNPFDLGKNHQVLAYGYDTNPDGTVSVHVYDPNTDPVGADSVSITFNPNDHTVPLTDNVFVDGTIRGFFRVPYSFNNAAPLEPAAPFLSNAWFVSAGLPGPFVTGQATQVVVNMKNIGTTVWTSKGPNPFRLGAQNPQDNSTWGLNRVELANDVAPGQTANFVFTVTPPKLQGVYDFQWRMVQELVSWFGQFSTDTKLSVASSSRTFLNVRLQPSPQPAGRAFQLTVFANDPNTGAAVQGEVLLNDRHVGVTGKPFTTTIPLEAEPLLPGGDRPVPLHRFPNPPDGVVRALNYADTEITWNVHPVNAKVKAAGR